MLEIDGPIGNKYALESNPSFLVPEDSTSNQNKGVVPLENFEARGLPSTMNVSSVLNIEPLHYASDISKRPLGALSVESVGVGKIHIQLEDTTIGIANGSHRPAGTGFLVANGTDTDSTNAGERLEMEPTPGISEFGLGTGVFRFNKTRIDNIKLESSDGFLVADGTDGSSTNENERLHLEDSLCTNFEERLILNSATIFDYVENTDAVTDISGAENTFDSSSIRFDSGLKTFHLHFYYNTKKIYYLFIIFFSK